ncbi:FliH/SctL family protein [Jatrophihabitans sp.]|uniref:FliH/SctL family protein n=1 Tax=Jatrophihabitans sp. TaxID=1932789 RepID=UPI002C5D92A7|nr:FliH/SctL family protein [Jatrophihabitans sp.]
MGSLAFDFGAGAAVPERLVEQARAEARAVGYAQGWAHGVRSAAETQTAESAVAAAELAALRARHSQQVGSALQALQAAAADLRQRTVTVTDEISDQILAAAVQLAEALLGRELRDPAVAAPAALARVLALVPDDQPVTVWLSPADHDTLTGPDGPALIGSVEGATGRALSYEMDPELQPGDARARCGSSTIDARLSAGVERLREYLAR